jgi:hypothetical protein
MAPYWRPPLNDHGASRPISRGADTALALVTGSGSIPAECCSVPPWRRTPCNVGIGAIVCFDCPDNVSLLPKPTRERTSLCLG